MAHGWQGSNRRRLRRRTATRDIATRAPQGHEADTETEWLRVGGASPSSAEPDGPAHDDEASTGGGTLERQAPKDPPASRRPTRTVRGKRGQTWSNFWTAIGALAAAIAALFSLQSNQVALEALEDGNEATRVGLSQLRESIEANALATRAFEAQTIPRLLPVTPSSESSASTRGRRVQFHVLRISGLRAI